MTAAPPIPARLDGMPTVGGLAIPWVTVILANGQPDWRACIRSRVDACITQHLCQLDGQPIHGPAVFFAAHDQLPANDTDPIITDVPPVHPECAPYAAANCPMLNGHLTTYPNRAQPTDGPRGHTCPDADCDCGGWVRVDDRVLAGETAPTWHRIWAPNWAWTQDPDGGALMAVIYQPARIRPIHAPSTHDTEGTL